MPSAAGDTFRRTLTPSVPASRSAVPELDLAGEIADYARRIYCGKIGAEFMHIPLAEKRRWVAERLETDVTGAGPAAHHDAPD